MGCFSKGIICVLVHEGLLSVTWILKLLRIASLESQSSGRPSWRLGRLSCRKRLRYVLWDGSLSSTAMWMIDRNLPSESGPLKWAPTVVERPTSVAIQSALLGRSLYTRSVTWITLLRVLPSLRAMLFPLISYACIGLLSFRRIIPVAIVVFVICHGYIVSNDLIC